MRQWAISVGINQYQFFQPLSYAQHDAQAIQRFLVEDAGVPAEQCLLLTETSPPQWGKSTYPDRETIQSWLDLLIQRYVEPGDVLWCFFSGYGVCHEGQDYLVPIEGNPAAIAATAIPLEAIFRSLRQVTSATILVSLDIDRNGSSSYEKVGTHTTHLASITGIPTILSCQPGQFSRETSALGHGFFTAALLESLRERRCTTVATVAHYLSDRLPELSEHYWRPIQQAVTICPDEKLQQPILPSITLVADAAYQSVDRYAAQAVPQNGFTGAANGSTATAIRTSFGEDTPHIPYSGAANGNGLRKPTPSGQSVDAKGRAIAVAGSHLASHAATASYVSANGSTNGSPPSSNGSNSVYPQATGSLPANSTWTEPPLDSVAQNHDNRVAPVQVLAVSQPHSDHSEDANEIPDALFWRPVLRWGGFAVVALILGVLLRNCASFTAKAPATVQQPGTAAVRPSPSSTMQPGVTPAPSPAPSIDVVLPAATAPAAAKKTLPPQPIATAQAFGVSGTSRLTPTAVTTDKLQPAIQKPRSQVTMPAIAPSAAASPLRRAKAIVAANSNQASPYWYAIREARTVKPGQPEYAQAQKEIASWSRRIFLIAQERSDSGRYDAAIVSARLVPQDQPGYAKAKSAIETWCNVLDNQKNANPLQRRQARIACRNRG